MDPFFTVIGCIPHHGGHHGGCPMPPVMDPVMVGSGGRVVQIQRIKALTEY